MINITMSEGTRKTVLKAVRAASFALVLKGAVGGSVALLALFGVVVPYFGFEPTLGGEGAVAGAGAILGALLALKS